MSEAFNPRARCITLDVSDARRLKALEEENARLNRLLAEQMCQTARNVAPPIGVRPLRRTV